MNFDFYNILYSLPAVIIGLTVHEYFHAFTASKLGDNTAKEQGRRSFNPLKHIDPFGFLFIIIAGFGWAKPVQFNPTNLSNARRDKALIALAGPLSNLVIGILFILIVKTVIFFGSFISEPTYKVIVNLLLYMSYINFGLFVFNILPLPPLDGSHIFFSGINIKPEIEANLMKFGSYALFIILIIESRLDIDILPIGKLTNAFVGLFF